MSVAATYHSAVTYLRPFRREGCELLERHEPASKVVGGDKVGVQRLADAGGMKFRMTQIGDSRLGAERRKGEVSPAANASAGADHRTWHARMALAPFGSSDWIFGRTSSF